MLRVAVVDDNPGFLNTIGDALRVELDKLSLEYAITAFSDPNEFLRFVTQTVGSVDMLILDIDLGYANGIEIARLMNEKYPRTKIIYITAHYEYSSEISDTDFSYYLLKPLSADKLSRAIAKTLALIKSERSNYISAHSKGLIYKIPVENIIYIESDARTARIFQRGEEPIAVNKKLAEFEAQLSDKGCFARIHQSFLVNLCFVKRIKGLNVYIDENTVLPIAKARLADVRVQFTTFLGGEML